MRHLIATSALLAVLFQGIGQQYHFRTYSRSEGLPSVGAYELMEDRQGFLWIATQDGGVSRFDGQSFQTWNVSNGLLDPVVRALHQGPDDTIWLGTSSNGVARLVQDSVVHLSLPLGTEHLEVRALFSNADHQLFAATLGNGLMRVVGDSLLPVSTPPRLHVNIRDGAFDQSGNLWLATDDGVWRKSKASWKHFPLDDPALCLHVEASDSLWVGTESGAWAFQSDSLVRIDLGEHSRARIRDITTDAMGNIWLATRTLGIARVYNREVQWFNATSGLPDKRIRSLLIDRNGTLWSATRFGGIASLSDLRFEHFTAADGFLEESITAILCDRKENLWFGTYSGELFKKSPEGIALIFDDGADTDLEVTALAEIDGGSILIGTDGRGVLQWDAEGLRELYPHEEVGRVLGIASDGNRWIIAGSELCIDHGFVWEDVTRISALSRTSAALIAASGDLWIGTANGLYHSSWSAADGAYSGLEGVTGTRNLSLTSLSEGSNGVIWAGTIGDGVVRVEDTFASVHRNLPFVEQFEVSFVREDRDKSLWIGTPEGLHHMKLDSVGGITASVERFGRNDGFVGVEVNHNAAVFEPDGSLWVGTVEGVSRIRSAQTAFKEHPPEPFLIRASQGEQDLEPRKGLSFSASENTFDLAFRAVHLSKSAEMRYRVRLLGHENSYRSEQSTNTMRYANLQPGEYTFQVRASADGQHWSEARDLIAFEVRAPFYRTTWFRCSVVLALLVLVRFIVRLRLRVLRARNRLLEAKVLERTEEVREEKAKSEALLLNILPQETADELKQNGHTTARSYPNVTVLFTDFKGFTQMSEQLSSAALVQTLDRYFRAFDRLTAQFGVEKIKTIGDAYMCATGIPTPTADHADLMVQFAQAMLEEVNNINAAQRLSGNPAWNLRVGMHSGAVTAGVVGEKKFAFDIWGDTVNTAARMESAGEIGRINISKQTFELIKEDYVCEPRGLVSVKNKGPLEMYFVSNRIEKRQHENLHSERRPG